MTYRIITNGRRFRLQERRAFWPIWRTTSSFLFLADAQRWKRRYELAAAESTGRWRRVKDETATPAGAA